MSDYDDLRRVLDEAAFQAVEGKGRERHANGRPFRDQPIMRLTDTFGLGFPLGQIGKKTEEAGGMIRRNEARAAIHELRGVIVYAAAAILALEGDVK